MADKIQTIQQCETLVRRAVKSQGRYTPDLEPAMKIAARDYRAYLAAAKDVAGLECTYYQTFSREGNPEFKEHPAIKTMERCQKMALMSLKAVGLTLQTIATTDDDPLDSLINSVKEV